jgi:hypothetical protein
MLAAFISIGVSDIHLQMVWAGGDLAYSDFVRPIHPRLGQHMKRDPVAVPA